jgi:hypothetical protein
VSAADRLAPLVEALLQAPPPFRIRCWDGSEAGPARTPSGRTWPALTNLSNRLGEMGRREDALAAGSKAIDIRRELAARWPDAHHHELATAAGGRFRPDRRPVDCRPGRRAAPVVQQWAVNRRE